MANEVKRLFSHTAVTSAGNIAHGVFAFLLLPLYSRYLPPDAFGKVELLMASVMLVGTFAMLGLPSALARRFNYAHSDDAGMRRVAAATALLGIVASTGGVALACAALSPTLASWLLSGAEHAWLVSVGAATLVATAVVSACTTVMRGLYRTVSLSVMLLVGALVNAGVAAGLVLGAGKTFEAPVIAAAASQGAMALMLLWGSRDHLGGDFSKDEMRRMLAFGLPLIFAGLSFYLLSTADRYLIRYFLDEATVGLYGMGVRLASILTVAIFAPFRMVWNVALYDIARRPDARELFARFTTQFTAAGLVIVAGLALFAELPLRFLLDERYWEAERVVGMLGLGLLLLATSEILKVGLLVEDQTRWLPVRVVIAGVCNVALDVWWIPRMGMYGAALATVVSFFVLNATTLWLTRSIYPLPLEWRRLGLLAVLAVLLAAVYVGSLDLALASRHGLRAATFAAFVAALLLRRVLDARQLIEAGRDFLARARARRSGA